MIIMQRDDAGMVQALRTTIASRCILTSKDAWLVSTMGNDYKWLIDMRQAFLNADSLAMICQLFWDRYAALLPFQLGGLEVSAIPLVVGLTMTAKHRGLHVNGFIMRKERKPSGVGKVLEGEIGPEPIFIVDDILNSANSMDKVRVTLEEHERTFDRAFVVVDYRAPSGTSWKQRHGITVDSVFSLDDFGLSDVTPPRPTQHDLTRVWRFASPSPNHFHVVPKSAPVVAGRYVLFGSDRGTLWARDVETGAFKWSFQIGHPGRKGIWSRVASAADRVYFGGYDGNLYCLALEDGRELWRASCADWVGSSPVLSQDDGLLWIGLEHENPAQHGSIAAFDMFTGRRVWEHAIPAYVHGTPAFSAKHGAVAIGANDQCLYLVDAFTGALRWMFGTKGEIKDAPVFDERRDLVYAAGFDGCLRALDVLSGAQVWAFQTASGFYASPLLIADKLFIAGTDKFLHVLNLESGEHAKVDLGSKSLCTPALVQGHVWVGANNGRLFEIDAANNNITCIHNISEPVTNRVTEDPESGLIFALTSMNQLYAFRRSEPGAAPKPTLDQLPIPRDVAPQSDDVRARDFTV